MSWFNTIKAADFAFYNNDDEASRASFSNFHRKDPFPNQTPEQRADESPEQRKRNQFKLQAGRGDTTFNGAPSDEPSAYGVRPKRFSYPDASAPFSVSGTDGARGQRGRFQNYVGDGPLRRTFEDSAITNLAAFGHDYEEPEEGEDRKEAIGEADEKIIPDLVNTNVHEVGHNATGREIRAAIDAEEGLTPEQKRAKEKYANEYAAYTMGEFSDPTLGFDEDGNPLDEEERWKKVLESREQKMRTHPDTGDWRTQMQVNDYIKEFREKGTIGGKKFDY
jgi:hypothetical protein